MPLSHVFLFMDTDEHTISTYVKSNRSLDQISLSLDYLSFDFLISLCSV